MNLDYFDYLFINEYRHFKASVVMKPMRYSIEKAVSYSLLHSCTWQFLNRCWLNLTELPPT